MATVRTLARDAAYIINGSFRLLKKLRAGDTLEVEEETQALEILQDMMRAWEVDDTPLFKKESLRVTLVASQGMYELNTLGNVRDVHHAQYVDNVGGDFPLDLMPGRTYLDFPVKDTEGVPTQYWFDRSPSSYLPSEPATDASPQAAKLYLWPKPYVAVVANGGVVDLQVSVPFAVPTLTTDPLDVPESWYKALRYCLAAELWEEYGGNDIRGQAREMWEDILDDYRPAFVDFEMDGVGHAY